MYGRNRGRRGSLLTIADRSAAAAYGGVASAEVRGCVADEPPGDRAQDRRVVEDQR